MTGAEASVVFPREPWAQERATVTVEETEDAWLIRDSIIAVPGVFNGKLRSAEELARTAAFWEGVPIIYPHPDGPVVTGQDLRMVGGRVENVRVDPAGGAVVGTYRLYRRSVPGFELNPLAQELNEKAVENLRSGQPVENSIGYLHDTVRETGTWQGQEYRLRAMNIVPNHLAFTSVLPGARAACPWPVCGAGAGQEAGGVAYPHPHSTTPGTSLSMPDCAAQECKQKHDATLERASRAETALGNVAEAAGLERTAKPDEIVARIRKTASEGAAAAEALKPLREAESRRHARSLKAVVDAELPAALAGAGHEASEDKERKALEDEFKGWSSEQLDRHLTSLARHTSTARGGNRDGTRFTAGQESTENLGVANARKVWPRQPTKGASQ